MVAEKVQIGSIVSDTGKLIICDPAYLSKWIDNKVENKREYKDLITGNIYVYGTDFKTYDDILLEDKSVNDLISDERLQRIPLEESGEFSNKSVSHGILDKGISQCKFEDGRKGLAFAFATLLGDGEFPIFAEFQEDRISKIWIDFTVNFDEPEDEEDLDIKIDKER